MSPGALPGTGCPGPRHPGSVAEPRWDRVAQMWDTAGNGLKVLRCLAAAPGTSRCARRVPNHGHHCHSPSGGFPLTMCMVLAVIVLQCTNASLHFSSMIEVMVCSKAFVSRLCPFWHDVLFDLSVQF